MYIINQICSDGEGYDNSTCLFACKTKEDAEKSVALLKKIFAFNKQSTTKFKVDIEVFKKTLGYKTYPAKPHKSTQDPKDLISQKDWMIKFVKPYNDELQEISKFNSLLDRKVTAFKSSYPFEIPVEFEKFKNYVKLNEYWYDDQTDFSIEGLEIVSFDE